MKKSRLLLLLVGLFFSFMSLSAQAVWDGTVATSFAGGSGTEDDPYLISNGAELAYLAQITKESGSQTSGKYYKLIDNILLNEDVLDDNLMLNTDNIVDFNKWIPIGYGNNSNSASDPYSFMGNFDGNSHVVSGVYVVNNGNRYAGLFGVCDGGEIHNLAVVDSYVDANGAFGGAVIAAHLLGYSGYSSGMKVYQCYAEGYVKGAENTGLIVGHNGGEKALISESYCYGRMYSTSSTGAVAGYCDRASIKNCYSVALTGLNGTSYVYRGSADNIYFDKTENSRGSYATGKTTEEMQSEEFVQLLGEPFVYVEGNYPYIEGLPVIGEDVPFSSSGLHLNRGAIVNGRGSSIRYYREFDGTTVSKSTSRAEAGETLYLKVTPRKRMLLTDGSLQLVNDETGEALALTSVGESIWSFTMPESSVTVTAAFHRDPNVAPLWDGTVAESFSEGEGTKDDPYLIHDGDELAYLAQLCNANGALTKGKYYKLANDICLNEDVLTDDFELNGTPANEWTPIGNTSNNKFQGHIDGNDHIISGMYISKGDYPAFISYAEDVTISNLSLMDSYVNNNNGRAAALVDYLSATDTSRISRCYVEAAVYCSSTYYTYYVGGIVNDLGKKCAIENCYTSGKLTGGNKGGIAVIMQTGSSVRNCFSTMQGAPAIYSATDSVFNVYSDEDLGVKVTTRDDYCSKHTIEMHTLDFATRIGEPYEYVLGNYPYIPGLPKIGESRGWKTPEDPTHGGAGGSWDGETSILFASGTGTEADPYIINNGAQLSYLAKLTNANGTLTKGRYYKLEADISLNADKVLTDDFDLNGTPTNAWEPIGQDSNHKFQGNFDGNDHIISGMYIPKGDYSAFIGFAENATICNLSLIDSYVITNTSRGAGLVTYLSATDTSRVSRCYVETSVTNSSNSSYYAYYAGGIVNDLGGKCAIENCYATGKLTSGCKGGIAVIMQAGSSVRNCFSVMKDASAIYNAMDSVFNVYSDEDLGVKFTTREDYCSKHTIEMHTTDFATRMGEPYEYVLGNYPYIPGLLKIGENRGWQTPEDPTHGGAGGSWDGESSIIFAGGTGTEDDPYIINNGAQLSYLVKLTNANASLTKGRYYKLDADISLNADSVLTSDYELNGTPANVWTPIGYDSYHKFQGHIDGNDHNISGMYIPSADYPAFISYAEDATICNLSLIDSYVNNNNSRAAALVNYLSATDTSRISRCYVEATVYSSSTYYSYYVGGIVNDLGKKCAIENCYTSGKLAGGNKGGIAVIMQAGSSVRNCFSVMKGAPAIYSATDSVFNVYSDEDLGVVVTTRDDYCSKHTIEMHTVDFATRMGEPYVYLLGNYPYIPGLPIIGETRGWQAPEDPTHGGAGGSWDGETSILFASGTGTEADPYIINNGAQLSYLAKLTNANGAMTKGRYYKLEADISLNADKVLTDDYNLNGTPTNVWEPIGKDSNHKFQGFFDGNGYTVSGMYIPSADYPAFIGYAHDATISNLSLIDSYVNNNNSRAAALVNYLSATDTSRVSRCYVEANVYSSSTYYTYYVGGIVNDLGRKCAIENCYTSGKLTGGNKGGIAVIMQAGSSVRNCFSTMKGAPAIYGATDSVFNVYFDSDRAGTTSNVRDDFRSAETTEMLSTDFATRMGVPFEYATGYYPYIYGLHKIDKDGKTSIVNGYPLQLGTLENGNDCTVEFYRGYKKKNKELSLPVIPGSKVFVDNATTIYVQVSSTTAKRLTDEGLIVTANTSGKKIEVTEVDYDIYSFQITDDAVTVTGAFLDGNFCGDPEVNNGRDVRWQLSNSKSKLTIEGNGNMVAGAWKSFANSVQAIEIGEGVTNVAAQAFKGMNKVTTATLPATLETIGSEAFSGCAASVDLRPCTLLTALHANEFAQFTGTLYLPATVTTIETDAFAGTYANVQHVYSPVVDGMTLFANDEQVPDVDGMGDIARYGITDNQEVRLVWGTGYLVTTAANNDGTLKIYADEALNKEIPAGYKAIRTDDQTRIYVKVNPKDTKILFLNGLTVKAGSSTLAVKQEGDEVFSFLMPKSAVSVSAQFATGGYCGNTTVNNGHNLIWTLDGNELAFQKNSFAQGEDLTMGNNAPWSTLGSDIKAVDLDNVTNIGNNAFASCPNLVGLELPATPVVTVGDNAFASQMVLIIPAESWDNYQEAGWAAYAEQTAKDKETLTLANGLQWRTYYSKVGRMLPEGLKAYTVTNIGYAEVVTSDPLNYVPAGQAVLIENSAKTASTAEAVTSLETCLLTTDEDNLLQWIAEPTAVSAGQGYTLYKDEFVKVSSGTLPAGVAFLPAQGSSASRLGIFVTETTGIDAIENTPSESDNLFNLKGQRVDKPTVKGLYLKNGKKVVIK